MPHQLFRSGLAMVAAALTIAGRSMLVAATGPNTLPDDSIPGPGPKS